ncbi:MAG: hypothetical protein K8T91_15335 [Planctomycetes bacterium]|nr:hypothetical protein [Planctomycetota bacterium]
MISSNKTHLHSTSRVTGRYRRIFSVCSLVLSIFASGSLYAADPAVEPKPLGQWLFTPEHVHETEVANLAGGAPAKVQRKAPLVAAGQTHAIPLDGGANAIAASDKELPGRLRSKLTAESWVRIDSMPRWSRSVGVMARQHDQRLGWVLGTHHHRFVFSLGSGPKGEMTDLHSAGSAHPGRWYHLAGTYDGKVMRLYVNGLLMGESTQRTGDILLPVDTPLSMVDYHDGAEFYPLRGLLNEVRVYDQVLSQEQIRGHYLAKAKQLEASPPLVMSGCFGDNMVLQRDVKLTVWGQTLPGDAVTVACAGKQESTKADAEGNWRVSLPPLAVGGTHEMLIETPQGKITYQNVAVGEVWYCAGQSNMAVDTKHTPGYRLARQPNPQIRLFMVVRESTEKPSQFTGGHWDVCDAGTVAEFSAVGYYFGRRLNEELKVPIGLFNASWGGTPVESWISREALSTLPKMEPHFQEKPADYWERAGLYNQMTHPLIPFAIRGAIWYQGEGNVGNAHFYQQRFGLMIADWRKRWGQGDFPFYYVQIAPFNYGGHWNTACAELWDAQRRSLTIPNTGMAVASDSTNIGDNHASNKLVIGERLALWALAKTYGREKLVYSGPLYRAMKVEGDKIRLTFDHAAGLKSRDGKPLDWFTIAGSDRKFVAAEATIEPGEKAGEQTLVIRSASVKEPVAVRFAWSGIAQPNLVNEAGLPASPFRTDDWPGILQEMEAEKAKSGK